MVHFLKKFYWGIVGTSLEAQWLGVHALTAEGLGSIPSWGTKIPQATWCSQKQNFFFFYCSRVDLQFCVSFRCTAK